MGSLSEAIVSTLARLTPLAVVDILIAAFLLYQFLIIIKGRRAAQILAGLSVLFLLYLTALYANLELVRTLLATLAPYAGLGLIVMFQSEIRRMLAQLGRRRWIGFGSRLKRREFVEELMLALDYFHKHRIGSLIVLERYAGLRTFVESGVLLDAAVSRDLLLSIFHPGGALHDGAVIIQNERIAAAACFLPATVNPAEMSNLGTRHRAAIGVSEETDCLALVVSEETGKISAASFGHLDRDLTLDQIDALIAAHLGGRTREQALAAETEHAVSEKATPEAAREAQPENPS